MAHSGKPSNTKISQGSSFFGTRRKSVHRNPDSKEQAPFATQTQIPRADLRTPEPLGRPAPRPQSSWYSQPSISEEAIFCSPSVPVPRMSNYYLRPRASQEAATNKHPTPIIMQSERRRSSHNSWEDESPGGIRQNSGNSYPNTKQHTVVSEYIRDRSWRMYTPRSTMPGASVEYSVPDSPTPPIPSSNRPLSVLHPFSIRRGSSRHSCSSDVSVDIPLEQPRRESILQQASRRASSIRTTWPYSMLAKAQRQAESAVTPSSYGSTPRISDSAALRTPYAPLTESFISTPYHSARQGPTPILVKSLNFRIPQEPRADPIASLKRGLTKHYGAGAAHRTSLTSTTVSSVVPPSYHTSAYEPHTPYPPTAGARLLTGGNDNARELSNQGWWLYIGTMRGPIPEGVRMIDAMMAKSLNKKGNTEKGIKEIRKVLRHEKRTVIEWVEDYVRRRWDVEV